MAPLASFCCFMRLTLSYKDCTGIDKVDRYCYLDKAAINPATGKSWATNPATGNWDDTYFSEVVEPAYKKANPNVADLAAEQNALRTQAIQPAVNSLTASKPEITNTFDTRGSQLGAEKDPLIARYQTLLDSITNNQNKDITQQGKVLSQEYGARGIPLSSGAYQTDLANKDTSINQNYSNQTQTTGLAREADLRDLSNQISNLANQKTTALRDVDNKIAELQAGAGNQAVTDALVNYRASLDQQFQSRFDDLNKKILEQQANPQVAETKPFEFNNSLYTYSGGNLNLLKQGAGGNAKAGVWE